MSEPSGSPARRVAATVLLRCVRDRAWASPTLDAELRRAELAPRDAALATEIVYGTLRALPALDAAIERHLKRGTRVDPWARAVLRTATYQLLHLERVPPHAVVHDSVELVRRERGRRVGGFVNAVLRKVAAQRSASPTRPRRMRVPDWLAEALVDSLGEERAAAFLHARPLPPPIGLRARGEPAEALARTLREAAPNAEIEPAELAPEALLVRGIGDPRRLPGYREGRFVVQEQGSQIVGRLAGAQPGESVVDACAGHGGKTLQLAEAVGSAGRVVAIDVHEPKLDRIAGELERLGLDPDRVTTEPIDLTVGLGRLAGERDRVLVDAPCTNVGTLHRRPELLLRLDPEVETEMAKRQRAIAAQAARLLRPGGRLVYAVCSPLRQEAVSVAEAVEAERPELRRVTENLPLDLRPDADGVLRLGPWLGDMDAYQVVVWEAVRPLDA